MAKRSPSRVGPLPALLLLLVLLLGACVRPVAVASPPPDSSGMRELVVTADRRASEAGLAMLRAGGAPIDAAVAAQAVLGLVEPDASGLGGGSVLLTWRAADATVTVIDGTPRAGHDAPAGLNLDPLGHPLDPAAGHFGGGAVGVPGTLPALWRAHRDGGRLPWAALFAPAIRLAEDGFAVSPGLHDLLAAPGAAALYGEAAAPWLRPDGTPPAAGEMLRAPAYAATLRRVAALGPAGLYDGAALPATLAALQRGGSRSLLTEADLAGYQPTRTAALCLPWRGLRLCTAPPPSFGGLVALQILGIAGAGDLGTAAFAHVFLDAGRLAEADRRRFVGDPAFVPVPAEALLDPTYLAARAALIPARQALRDPAPGAQPGAGVAGADPGAPTTATSQIVAVARNGDALSMTTSLTNAFGARVAAGGVVFNNALANFAPAPPRGARYANGMAPGKRPATPCGPVLVLDAAGRPLLLGGSGGGPFVPDVVAAALLDMLAAGRTPAEALARPHLSSADPDHVAVEAATPAEALLPALRGMGYRAEAERLPSASAFARRDAGGWRAAADPRRGGVALGD